MQRHTFADQRMKRFVQLGWFQLGLPRSNYWLVCEVGGVVPRQMRQNGGLTWREDGEVYCSTRLRMPDIDHQTAIFFANDLRSARLAALADSEAFDEIIHVVERVGYYLTKEDLANKGEFGNLGNSKFKDAITKFADRSGLSKPPVEHRTYLTPFAELYELVRQARNDALHQGAFARHLTTHSIELAIILEDALSSVFGPLVSDFMVRNPVCAELWQPLSFIRQQMLANSFSYLPVLGSGKTWQIISDASVARFLGTERDGKIRRSRLSKTLQEARHDAPDIVESALVIRGDAKISEALEHLKDKSVFLIRHPDRNELMGILTAFDLL
jgi:CBS domain-containing protein